MVKYRVFCAALFVLLLLSCSCCYVYASAGGRSAYAPATVQSAVYEPLEVSETINGDDVLNDSVDDSGTRDTRAVTPYAPLSGGSYFVADSALGVGLVFYVPVDYLHKLAYTSDGDLFNLSASSVYLYCPSFPDYSIYAQRFSRFQFRPNTSGYSYSDCKFSNVDPVTVDILENADKPIISTDTLLVGLLALVTLLGCIFIIRR